MPAISKGAPVCETCGSPVETTSSGDFGCMVCLFDAALDRDTEESEVAIASPLDQFGAYTIEHHADGSAWELGRGAMGVTYRAIDKVLDRPVALKIINTKLGLRSAEARERFMREARAAAALRHPNVATVYQFGVREETGQFFYAMELIESETLEEGVRRLGPLDVLTTIDIALQVTAALAAAEDRGLVHRDLKPGNLMLVSPHRATGGASTQRGGYNNARGVVATALCRRARRSAIDPDQGNEKLTVKVIDFGVAKAAAEKTNAMALTHGGFVGTPAFASPEQFTNAPVDVRSDIYSLGATLWFLLTGHMPFSGRTVEEMRETRRSTPLAIEQLKAVRVPRRFVALLISMLAIEPGARPAGAHELATELQKIRHSITDRRKIAPRFAVAATFILILGVSAFFVFPSLRTHPAAAESPSNPAAPEKSIAVLPFENLSRDPDDAYFAEGIQEEVLTRLAKVTDLRVISRTSTQRYRSKPGNLSEIARQLGVVNIVEGSVQKVGNQVRVNVQLLNAQTDSHLWAESYDRELTDVFGVESEIAKGIAESLQAKLTSREEQALTAKPTNNPEAYDAYLRGVVFQGRIGQSTHLALKTIGYFERAVQLDPNFALAWARLSRVHAYLSFQRVDGSRPDAAKDALEHAQKLQPNSPETLLALGYYQYWVLRDYGLAKATFHLVNKMLPGNSEVAWALSAVNRRDGHWNESLASVEQGLARDPRNGELMTTEAWTYTMLRQFPTALNLYDRALDVIPNDPDVMSLLAGIYQAQGNLEQAAKPLSDLTAETPFDNAFFVKVTQLRLERNYAEAVRLLQARLARFDFTSDSIKGATQVYLAFAQRLAGDTAGAKVTAEQARNTLEPLCKRQPGNSNFVAWLGLANAVLGEKDLALKEAERAIMLLPSAKDRVDGPGLEENRALIQMIFGENSRALSTLSRLLQTPYQSLLYNPVPLTPAFLRLDPLWDPLRADPRFEKLVEEAEQQIPTELSAKLASDKSIAVLPFEDLSDDKKRTFIADGVQDDILTKLAKVTDLKVISRTSVMQYRGRQNTREIGKALDVSYVLEGSVRETRARLHINAQLIDTRTDTHVWAEQYDFDSKDLFAVQSGIAKKISERLHAKLSPTEEAAIEQAPTTRLPAFDLYTRAKNLLLRVGLSSNERANLLEAANLLNQAVANDSSFFEAYCLLSYIHDLLYFLGLDHTAARLALAETAIQAASRLRPDAGDTHLARAQNLYYGYLDYDAALAELELARQSLPNDPRVFELTGYIQRRQGHWEESTRNLERAIELDPRNTDILEQATLNYVVLRRYTEEKLLWDRMVAIVPNNPETQASRAQAELNSRADTRPLHQVVDSIRATNPGAIPTIAHAWIICALAERDATAAKEALIAADDNPINLGGEVYFNGLFMEGVIARMTKDDNKARSVFTAARAEQEKIMEAQPNFGPAFCVLGLIDAALGRKEEALREGRRAVELVPMEKDAMRSRSIIRYFAIIAAWVGDKDLACEQLSIAARPPSTLSYGQLKLLPLWDPLRGDPCFEKIVTALAPK